MPTRRVRVQHRRRKPRARIGGLGVFQQIKDYYRDLGKKIKADMNRK